jgi:DnaJ-domain-containing protein 1
VKHYLLRLITSCAPENTFARDAIEHAILKNRVKLTGELETDQQTILRRYDDIMEEYHQALHENQSLLLESYRPLIEKIQRSP